MSHEDEKVELERADLETAQLPAPYVDTYYLYWWDGHIRIALAEELANQSYFRFAFVMPIDEAEKFAKDILEAAKALKKQSK